MTLKDYNYSTHFLIILFFFFTPVISQSGNWSFQPGHSLQGEFIELGTHIKWEKVPIDDLKGEKTDAADINNDGKIDIVASNFWYENPSWEKHPFREDNDHYHRVDLTFDVNEDGWMDVVSAGSKLDWYENPGTFDGDPMWKKHSTIDDRGGHHQGRLYDLDGDGKIAEFVSNKPKTEWFSHTEKNFLSHLVSTENTNYGDGVADLNMDGRPDIIKPAAWYEAPENIFTAQSSDWVKHPIAIGSMVAFADAEFREKAPEWLGTNSVGQHGHTASILPYDVNQDGLPDLISGCGHSWGMMWDEHYVENGVVKFKHHIIDGTQSEFHTIEIADVDGDGDLDIVTGKRYLAHAAGQDPGWDLPNNVVWYELIRKEGLVFWARHFISFDDGVGAGQDITVIDIDKDGDLDVIAAGKEGGPYLFLQYQDPASAVTPDFSAFPDALALTVKEKKWTDGAVNDITWVSSGTIQQVSIGYTNSLDPIAPTSVAASSSQSSDYSADNTMDGNYNTRWNAGAADDQWLEYTFNNTVEIGRLNIGPSYKDRITDYILEAWVDGEWKTVYTGTKIGFGLEVVFPKVATTKMRFHVVVASEAPGLAEIRFYPGFTSIASDIPNTGSYSWNKPNGQLPENIVLGIYSGDVVDVSHQIQIEAGLPVAPQSMVKSTETFGRVRWSGLAGFNSALIYDLQGRHIHTLPVIDGILTLDRNTFSSNQMPRGLYYVKLIGVDKQLIRRRVIK